MGFPEMVPPMKGCGILGGGMVLRDIPLRRNHQFACLMRSGVQGVGHEQQGGPAAGVWRGYTGGHLTLLRGAGCGA